jgi:hypothetical protein
VKSRSRFVVIGAQALAAAGHPRYTRDLDVLVKPSVENARRVAEALNAFGFPAQAEAVRVAFRRPKQMFTLGIEPLAIDVLTSATGLTFEAAWRGRNEIDLGEGLVVPFLGVRELIVNKLATGRDQDLIDVDNLRRRALPEKSTKGPRATRRRPR